MTSKKQRVDSAQHGANTLCLVPARNLPQSLELVVLSFLSIEECSELPLVSKDVYALAREYFANHARSFTLKRIAWGPGHPYRFSKQPVFLLRFCNRLDRLWLDHDSFFFNERIRAMALQAIERNASTSKRSSSRLRGFETTLGRSIMQRIASRSWTPAFDARS
jgi:hypothetical protein